LLHLVGIISLLKRGVTEIVQIVTRHVQCTIHIPYTMISKALFITERGPNLGKVTFRTRCIKGVTLDPHQKNPVNYRVTNKVI
jgi:hypothetical protein